MGTMQQNYSLHAAVLNYEIHKRSVFTFAFLNKYFQTSLEYPDGPDIDRKFLRKLSTEDAGKYLITFYDYFLS